MLRQREKKSKSRKNYSQKLETAEASDIVEDLRGKHVLLAEDNDLNAEIAMTANAFTEDRMRAKEAGMDEHVAKPVDAKLLIKVIHKLMKRSYKRNL